MRSGGLRKAPSKQRPLTGMETLRRILVVMLIAATLALLPSSMLPQVSRTGGA